MGYTTLFVNKTQVSKALGDLEYPSNEWDLVFKPAYTQRLKSCGIAYLDTPDEIMPLALHYLGLDPHQPDAAAMEQALAQLKSVRADIHVFSNAMLEHLSTNKSCVGIAWSGDVDSTIGALKEEGSTDELVGAQPIGGTMMWVDAMVIPVNAKHPQNAHAFIDFYLRAKNAALIPSEIGYPNGNTAALAFVDADVQSNPLIFPPPDFFSKLVPSGTFSDKARWETTQAYMSFAYKFDAKK